MHERLVLDRDLRDGDLLENVIFLSIKLEIIMFRPLQYWIGINNLIDPNEQPHFVIGFLTKLRQFHIATDGERYKLLNKHGECYYSTTTSKVLIPNKSQVRQVISDYIEGKVFPA